MKKYFKISLVLLIVSGSTIVNAQTNLVPVSARIPELKLWVDAEEQTGADGSAVTTVTDQAGVVSGITVQGLVTLNITPSGKKEFSFAGLDNSINLGQPAALNYVPGNDDFTIMGFIGSGIPAQGALVSKGGNGGVQYHIEVSYNKFWTGIGNNSTSNYFQLSNGLIDENIHYAMTVDSNGSKLYINGQLIETRGTSSVGTATYVGDILIGDTATWDWEYSDHIRSVGIFSKALSDVEVLDIYNDIINPPSEPNSDPGEVWTQTGNNIHFNNGNVGIGITNPSTDKLAVNGNIRAKEVKVEIANWPDYVFDKGYNLPSLKEIKNHIQEKGHLPKIPSAAEMEQNGVELGEMNKLLLEKIEELTLYILKQQEEIEENKRQIRLINDH